MHTSFKSCLLLLAVLLVLSCGDDVTAVNGSENDGAPISNDVRGKRGGTPGPGGSLDFDPAADTGGNSFVLNGVDWNEVLGVSEQILWNNLAQNQVHPGEFVLNRVSWILNAEYPPEVRAALDAAGYVYGGETPAEDFLAKVDHVYAIIDAGMPQERHLIWEPDGSISYGSAWDYGLDLFGFLETDVFLSGWAKIPPQNPGVHQVTTGLVMAGLHNDGYGTEPWNFLMPGPAPFLGGPYKSTREFTVVP